MRQIEKVVVRYEKKAVLEWEVDRARKVVSDGVRRGRAVPTIF